MDQEETIEPVYVQHVNGSVGVVVETPYATGNVTGKDGAVEVQVTERKGHHQKGRIYIWTIGGNCRQVPAF